MHRMTSLIILIIIMATIGFAPVLRAEKVPMSPEALRKMATHVVLGTVKQIYERKEQRGGFRITHYVAEILLGEVEKGEGLRKGDLAYVRYWTQEWTGPGDPPPGTSGHHPRPKTGETLRIYLARNAYHGFGTSEDGGFDVFGANGFERLP